MIRARVSSKIRCSSSVRSETCNRELINWTFESVLGTSARFGLVVLFPQQDRYKSCCFLNDNFITNGFGYFTIKRARLCKMVNGLSNLHDSL